MRHARFGRGLPRLAMAFGPGSLLEDTRRRFRLFLTRTGGSTS